MNYNIQALFSRVRKLGLEAKYAKAINLYLSDASLSEVEIAEAVKLKRVTFNSFLKRTLRPLITYTIRVIEPKRLGLTTCCFHVHPTSAKFDECKAFLISSEFVRMMWTTPGDQLVAFVVGESEDIQGFKHQLRKFDGVMDVTPLELAKFTQPIPPSVLTRSAKVHK